MGRKRSIYYINKTELLNELKQYNEDDIISEELGLMLLKIAQRYSSRANFIGYSYRDEFVCDAVYRMVDQLKKINVNHPNCQPFSYLTKMCHRCFIARIMKEKKYQNLKQELTEKYFNELEVGEKIVFKRNDGDDIGSKYFEYEIN